MIRIDGSHFKDEFGRTLMLRGVNLGGSSKVPFKPNGATHNREGFFDHRNVSFVGRPFPLEEADEHFRRLREWGMAFLRFLVTWEAIEHAGPGIYDEEYLDYVHAIVKKASEYEINLFIDPHQDVWSRFSGGDGAPGWTFEAIGMDVTKFAETGAAIVRQVHGDPFPRMIWHTNATKLAAATMFTLFFGGNDFAPQTQVNGESVQEFLQRHYVGAIKQIAMRLQDMPNVVGYDTLNEPLSGFIGCTDLNVASGFLRLGASPTPFQAMLLGAGYPQEIESWTRGILGPKMLGYHAVNPNRVRVWRDGFDCVWRRNGVWDGATDGTPKLLRPDHFAVVNGRRVDFSRDYYRPFANRYARETRSVDPDALIFVETEVNHVPPQWSAEDAANIAYAPHWYDGFVLFMKDYNPLIAVDMQDGRLVFGSGKIRKSFAAQLARFKQQSAERLKDAPVLLGEFGIAFDLKRKRAYRTGDWRAQIAAMDRSFRAVEDDLLNCTLWNYTADNSNAHGDQWNDEDLSIFSRDQQQDPNDVDSGGRALQATVRPYARQIAGEPLRMCFDIKRRVFEFEFRHDGSVAAPTEVFIPNLQYPRGYVVQVSDGSFEMDRQRQTLIYRHSTARPVHSIRVKP
jgi:hypothetical protein